MKKLSKTEPREVFDYFEEICSIPHGSNNTDKICAYLVGFAQNHSLEYYTDNANNVIIYKKAARDYEDSAPVILQGHIDMVCQKTDGCDIDFEKDGLDIFAEDGFVKARGTTLGADNGIAVAMMLAILSSPAMAHPALECVFTSDEEVGMVGALALDMSKLGAKRMINLDGGGENSVLISCAGGADFCAERRADSKTVNGTKLTVSLEGLPGGHSGTQINSGIENANAVMTKILKCAYDECPFEIISLNGGNKTNVITPCCTAELVVRDATALSCELKRIADITVSEISGLNRDMKLEVELGSAGEYSVSDIGYEIIRFISSLPNGVIALSREIDNLVETSANIGIVRVTDSACEITVSVRSSKKSSLDDLLNDLADLSDGFGCKHSVSGAYPPWELKKDTELQRIYTACHKTKSDKPAVLRAIHAGLECGIFDSAIDDLDCISIGPDMYDIHSPSERLSISSTKRVYEIVTEVLKNCK